MKTDSFLKLIDRLNRQRAAACEDPQLGPDSATYQSLTRQVEEAKAARRRKIAAIADPHGAR